MNTKNSIITREKYTPILQEFLESIGEDTGLIASNCLNFPVVAPDGEEGFVEVLIRVPQSDDGFEKREDYEIAQEKRLEQARKRKEEKEKKIERDRKRREERAAEREAKRKE